MRVIESLDEFKQPRNPLVLTIGNFDGMHRGHCAVLRKVKAVAGSAGQSAVITFRNHPSEILRPDQAVCFLCSLIHRLRMLEEFGIDELILLTFTKRLAQHNAAFFIENLRQTIPFTHLILGHDATLGRDRQGDRSTMQEIGDRWGFTVQYIEEYRFEGKAVSSSRIRTALQQGDLTQVEELLDRPYSIYATAFNEIGIANQTDLMTIRLDIGGLCLPPSGVYAVDAIMGSKRIQSIATLGSDFLEKDLQTQLRVHSFDPDLRVDGEAVEVVFKNFIRPDRKFKTQQEFAEQIREDMHMANRS